MTAKKLDLYIEQGADWFQDFPIDNPDGTPRDITGAHAALQIRSALGSPTAIVTMTDAIGNLIITPYPGNIRAILNALIDTPFPPGSDIYDLKMILGSATSREYQGTVIIDGEVTNISVIISIGQLNFSIPNNLILMPGVC